MQFNACHSPWIGLTGLSDLLDIDTDIAYKSMYQGRANARLRILFKDCNYVGAERKGQRGTN